MHFHYQLVLEKMSERQVEALVLKDLQFVVDFLGILLEFLRIEEQD
jgi:hypothetical protein